MADRQVLAVVKVLSDRVAEVAKKLILDATAELEKDTPVDTGWARSNWIPSIGKPIDDIQQMVTRSSKVSSLSSAAGLQNAGKAQILSYKLPMGDLFITNHVDYITKLNGGSSGQAPAMFVERAILRAIQRNS